jgi:hypothetical protein
VWLCSAQLVLNFCLGKYISNNKIYSCLYKIIKFVDLLNIISSIKFSIALVLVLLSFDSITITNTILTVGMRFQYNTSHIVHLRVLWIYV